MKEIRLPVHIGFIMDGNGRWARRRLRPRAFGHKAGVQNMIKLCNAAFEMGVRIVTVYALSTENLSRPKEELDGLFSLFRDYFPANTERLKRKGIVLRVIGDRSLLPEDIVALIAEGEAYTAGGTRGTLALAIGYGGRQDILAAVNEAVRRGREVDAEEFSAMLSTREMPEPDLLIRTGKELRISNFLLWQAAYSELYFTDVLFPDFSDKELDKAIEAYGKRERRYGKV